MAKDDFLKKLKIPKMESSIHGAQFRAYLLNSRRSGILGILLLLLPFIFVLSNVLEYVLKVNPGFLRYVADLFSWIDQHPRWWLLGPLLLLGGPLVAFVLNTLSVLHIHHEKKSNELVFSLKLKWINLIIIFICVAVVATLFLYLIVENA